jgi:hypothetical protein
MLEIDENKDGKISLQEWLKLAGDPNQNPPGQMNYQQRREALAKRFKEMDTNKDGFIDQAEIRTVALTLFKKIDLDGNGRITPQEWQTFNTPPPPPRQTPPPPPPPQGPTGPRTTGPKPVQSPPPGGLQPGVPLR